MATVIAVVSCVAILSNQIYLVQANNHSIKDNRTSSEASGILWITKTDEDDVKQQHELSGSNRSTVAYRKDRNSEVRNLTCSTDDVLRPRWETFLNYLLRLKTCSEVSHSGVIQLKEECAKIEVAPTDYHTIGYLRFCNIEKYAKVCRVNKIHITEVDNFGNQENGINVFKEYSLRMACSDVVDFSQELENMNLAEGIIPAVDHSEWNTTLVPFCPPFAFGVTRAKYHLDPLSLFTRMPSAGQTFVIFSIILDSILAIAIMLTNWFVLAVAIRTNIMKNVPGYFKISLAVADIIVGLFGLPLSIYTTYVFYIRTLKYQPLGQDDAMHNYMNEDAVNVFGFLFILTPIVSIYTLTFASVDRFLAITKPFEYSEGKYFNTRRCFLAITTAWLIGFFTGAFPIFSASGDGAFSLAAFNVMISYTKTSGITYFVILAVALLTVFSLNCLILIQITSCSKNNTLSDRKKSSSLTLSNEASLFNSAGKCCDEKIDSSKIAASQNGNKQIISRTEEQPEERPKIRNISAEVEHRVAWTLVIMIAAFSFALLPILCVLLVDIILQRDEINSVVVKTENRLSAALYVTTRILLSNSFWNCIIYSIRNSHFRCIMKAVFLCNKRRVNEGVKSCTL